MTFVLLLSFLLLGAYTGCSAPSGPWDAFNFAPESRTVYPRSVRETYGNVTDAEGVLSNGSLIISGDGSYVALDFGYEVSPPTFPRRAAHHHAQVAGIVSLNFDSASENASIALSWTESPLFISPLTSDDSVVASQSRSSDGVLNVPPPLSSGPWTQPAAQLRGGFRFLTIVSTSGGSVSLSNISCYMNFMPHFDSLRNYSGYFYAADPYYVNENFLTRVGIRNMWQDDCTAHRLR